MADYDIPDDLIALQRRIDAADAKVQGLLDGDREQLAVARAERLDLIGELDRHTFWKDAGNRFEADMALKRAARSTAG